MRLSVLVLLAACSAFARDVRITVLATTDLHANIYPWDYLTGRPAHRGLASLATLIRAERKASPNTLLIDAGDTVQGTPLASLWQTWIRSGRLPHNVAWQGRPPAVDPMILAMNHLGYDAMKVGNHEFNHGLASLHRTQREARFPWLAANVRSDPGVPGFAPYIVRTVAGVKVAILGITTPAIPVWEKPENIRGYSFEPAVAAAMRSMADLQRRHRPDIVVAAIHSGLERDITTGAARTTDNPDENVVFRVASEVKGIDAIVFGHTHQTLPEGRIGEVLLVQPKNWGMSLGAIDLELSEVGGKWTVRSKRSRLIPVSADTVPDASVLELARPYHAAAEQYLETRVTAAPAELSAATSRVQDTALIDAIHEVQLHYGKADVSLASAFNPRAMVRKGPVTVRELAALYIYDNELYTLQGNGRVLRLALENAARIYTCAQPSCKSGAALDRSVPGYNLDLAQGVTYDVDVTALAGQRIRNLRFRGKPLADEQPLKIAVNSYRAGGSGGYTMLRGLPVVWRSYEEIRDMMIRYYSSRTLPSAPDNNWRIVPDSARRALELEARRAAETAGTQ